MVHKKYIKRGGRVFGPYLYENYREKGVTKTRYLGLADSKKQKNKKRIDKSLVMVSIFLILIIVLGFTSLFLYETGFFGVGEGREGLGSYSPLDLFKKLFIASSPLNVFVQIRGNTAPEILGLPYGIELCENTELGGEIYKFYVEDKDGDFVFVTLDNPVPFYVEKFGDKPNVNITNVTVLSQPLFKKFVISNRNGNDAWAIWTLTINAKDILSAIAIPKSFDITIIEVNNAPEFDMDVATIELGDNIYTVGDEHVWTYDLGAYLHTPPRYEETLTADLIFNLTYVNGSLSPFSIDENGLINITGNESFIPEGEESWNFYLNVSVKDSGLSMRDEIHENISDCYGADPRGDEDYKSWSDDFWLTITKQNRAPVITSHYPPELNLSVVGEEALEFNLTARDPDYTPLDVQWYVDDVLRETDSDIREYNVSKFEYSFPCGVSGSHNISGVANDGLLNDSIVWNISVELVGCPGPASPGSPSGGSSSRVYCEEKWGCGQWTQCHNLNELFEFGWTRKETELLIKERCGIFGLGEEVCGFQQRICTDFNYCNTENEKPADIRECHYTENPTCEDGIKNCHSEGCEVLIDCGGPCEACPTCEDGIKNQKEERIDCGGPCEICVEQPLGPIILRYVVVYSLLLLLILILVLVGRQAIKYVRGKKIFTTSNTKNLIIRKGNKGLEKRNILKSLFFIGFIVVLLFFANNYMAGISQTNTIISGFSDVGEGLLSSYGFLNNLLGNLGLFFISVPVAISGNTRLQIFDDTEDYLIEWTERSGHDVYFYANYTENGDTGTYDPLSGGICNIRIQDSDKVYGLRDLMIYNSSPNSLLFEYSQTIDYKGKYLFDVNCSLGVLEVQAFDNFTIENTAPSINTDDGGIYIDFDDIKGDTDHLPCIEDVLCSYNFKTNITDPDTNDVWTYFVEESNTTLTDYDLDENGILNISITHSSNTGIGLAAKKIQLGVKDNELDALIYEAKLWVDVQEVNDKPIFRDLDNQTLIAEDRFIYDIHIDDEESNNPFVFNISVIKCAPLLRNNCTLLREVFEYTQDKDSGVLKIDFTPTLNDIGDYKINFSVMDYNETLGNSTASQVVNFTVNWPIWNESLITTYVLYEEVPFYLNLSKNVSKTLGEVIFSNGTAVPSFNISIDGIVNFTPDDQDVGSWPINIIATNPFLSSSKIFDFTIYNKNDSLAFSNTPLRVENAGIFGSEVTALENTEGVKLILFVEDNDLAIDDSQIPLFYEEKINLTLGIEGPNSSLFNFVFDIVFQENISKHVAEFTPLEGDEGWYNISINVTDANKHSNASFNFTLNIVDRNYVVPNITYPDTVAWFSNITFFEDLTTELVFRANHSVDEDLFYEIYVGDNLRNSTFGYGNDTNVTLDFTPEFIDETYGGVVNLTLIVKNGNFLYADLQTNRSWEIKINHTNAPIEFFNNILNDTYPVGYSAKIDLRDYFLDLDHEDDYYNQTIEFDVFSNDSSVSISEINEAWELFVFSNNVLTVMLNITASDLNISNESIKVTNITSNNFEIYFEEAGNPEVIIEYLTEPDTGGDRPSSGQANIVALKIITPGGISAYEGDTIDIPLQLFNSGEVAFNDIDLNAVVLKQGDEIHEIGSSLDKDFFNILNAGQSEDMTLTLFFNTSKAGKYEVLISAESRYPKYKDWAKIHIDLEAINESKIRELLVFTEEFVAENPQCMEIIEVVEEAEEYLIDGDLVNANIKTRQALESCRDAISQVSVPDRGSRYFRISLYFILTVFIALILGLVYYFIRRRQIQKIKKPAINKDIIKQKDFNR